MATKKQNWVFECIYLICLVILLSWTIIVLLKNNNSEPKFNPDAGDVCTEWKCDGTATLFNYTIVCVSEPKYEGGHVSGSVHFLPYKENCLKWLSKEEKLQQDIAELKLWKDSIKEECVDNDTITIQVNGIEDCKNACMKVGEGDETHIQWRESVRSLCLDFCIPRFGSIYQYDKIICVKKYLVIK